MSIRLASILVLSLSLTGYLFLGSWGPLREYTEHEHFKQVLSRSVSSFTVETIQASTDALASQSRQGASWMVLGDIYQRLRLYDRAISAYKKADALSHSDHIRVNALLSLANIWMMIDPINQENAIARIADRILVLSPAHPGALNLQALLAYNQEDYRQAIDYWSGFEGAIEDWTLRTNVQQAILKAQDVGHLDNGIIRVNVTVPSTIPVEDDDILYVVAKSEQYSMPWVVSKLNVSDAKAMIRLGKRYALYPLDLNTYGDSITVQAMISFKDKPQPEFKQFSSEIESLKTGKALNLTIN